MPVELIIGYDKRVGIAKCKKRAELQSRLGMSIEQGITDKYTIFVRNKDFLLGENHTAHPIRGLGYRLTRKLTDILMTIGAETIALILVQPQIEGRTMLYHGLVE